MSTLQVEYNNHLGTATSDLYIFKIKNKNWKKLNQKICQPSAEM